MALSKCPKCEKSSFELKELDPTGSNYKFNAIQCAFCGTVVGITDFYNNGAQLKRLSKAVQQIAVKLGVAVDLK